MKTSFSVRASRALRCFGAVLALTVALAGSAAAADALVSAQWLNGHRADQNLVVIDVRSAIDGGGEKAYLTGHIPGAVHSDYDKGGWRVTRSNLPFMVPTTSELEKLIGDLGIDETSHVVVVPAGVSVLDFGSAARTYWTLRYAGVKDVSILDGGFAAWTAAGYPTAAGTQTPSPKIFTAALDKSVIAQAPDVEVIEKSGGATLIDARPATFYTGKEKAPVVQAYGHIPGALNVDSAEFYDPATNRLKSKVALSQIADTIPAGPTIEYCNTGHWAATDWFVLHELLGRSEARLYAASMVEWTSDLHRPVASARTKWDDLKKTLGFGS
jgi:thiosulfate/3-mercaptopyruvate sulfurtransferase